MNETVLPDSSHVVSQADVGIGHLPLPGFPSQLGTNLIDLSEAGRANRLAVATALAGEPEAARALLDRAGGDAPPPELLANRGALHAISGNRQDAEADLRRAVERAPRMLPVWRNLAAVLEASGRRDEAVAVRHRADAFACQAPRHYPYGLGTGEIVETRIGGRWLLKLEDGQLALARPADFRRRCDGEEPTTTEPQTGARDPEGAPRRVPDRIVSVAITIRKQ